MKIDKILPAGGDLQHFRADRAISSGAKRRRAPVAGATPLSIVLWLRGTLPARWGRKMHIAMIGSGYVGLVSGACLADFGHTVVCIDSDGQKIEALKAGKMPIFEPGLPDIVGNNVRQRRLSFSTDLAAAVAGSRAVFIAVGTPSRRGDGHADLSFVYHAARAIAAGLDGFTVVVTKSTVPVGTGDEVERIIRETRPD
jgi:UDPglucose 6-dehydrogenase